MDMRMPQMGGTDHHGSGHHGPPMFFVGFMLFQWLFMIGSVVCFLGAINRAASALKLESRVKALKAVNDEFTDEEREHLIHKIKTHALGPY
jgi:hypothetical protein